MVLPPRRRTTAGPRIKGNFVLALIEVLSGLSQEQVTQVTSLFAVGCSGDRPNAAADGFFPPFWWLSDESMRRWGNSLASVFRLSKGSDLNE